MKHVRVQLSWLPRSKRKDWLSRKQALAMVESAECDGERGKCALLAVDGLATQTPVLSFSSRDAADRFCEHWNGKRQRGLASGRPLSCEVVEVVGLRGETQVWGSPPPTRAHLPPRQTSGATSISGVLPATVPTSALAAAAFEQKHVHDIYDAVSSEFSRTRGPSAGECGV